MRKYVRSPKNKCRKIKLWLWLPAKGRSEPLEEAVEQELVPSASPMSSSLPSQRQGKWLHAQCCNYSPAKWQETMSPYCGYDCMANVQSTGHLVQLNFSIITGLGLGWIRFVSGVWTYFPDSDHHSIHYHAYYTVTCQHEKKKTWHSVSFYNLFVTIHSVFQQRNVVRQTDAISLLPLCCFPFFFFSWPVMTTQLFAKSWNHRIFQDY